MKTTRFVLNALLIVLLVGCGTGTPTTPIAQPTRVVTPAVSTSFAIYLLANQAAADQLAPLCHFELESEPLLSVDDVITYHRPTHEIELTAAGYQRLHALQVPTSGTPFAVCVDGEIIYTGSFWTMLSSQSYDGVVILIDPIEAADKTIIQIQLGYPGPDFFRGEDPRSDPRVFQALKQADLLD